MDDIQRIRGYIKDNFLFGSEDARLEPEESLIENGVIDSTGVLELISFLEETFGIQVADEEMLPENLESIARMANFVARKRAA